MEPLISRRSTYALGLLLLIVVGLVFTLSLVSQRQEIRQKAAPQTSLEINPTTSTVNQGDQFSVNVVMNTAGNQVTKADLIITYDQQYLNGVSIAAGSFMPTVDMPGLIRNGTARIILSAPTTAPVSGNGVIATLTFQAINPTNSTAINFNTDTAISALGETGNVLVTSTPGAVTVNRTVNPDTTLTLSGPTSVSQGNDFNVDLQINTGTNLITSADVYLAYDPTRVSGVSVDEDKIGNQGFLPNILTHTTINNGMIHFSVGSTTVAPAQGSGILATITFHAVANGSTQIIIDPQAFVQAINSDENMKQTVNNLTLNITGQMPNPTPTPSPVPTATPIAYATPTPTPSATPGSGGGVDPTPTSNPCSSYQPSVPTSVYATALSASQIRLSWVPQSNVTHYGIVFGTNSRYYLWGAANVGNVSSYVVSQLSANTSYYFSVFSVNDCGASGYSSEASARTQSYGTGGTMVASPVTYASPKINTPSPTPTPPPGFVALNPNQSETEVIPFLAAKPVVSPVLVPSVVPQVSVPPDYQTQKSKLSPLLTPLGGIILIVLAIFLGIFFFRMRS